VLKSRSIGPWLRKRLAPIRSEIENHVFGYSVLAAFTAAGPLVAHVIFPDAPTGLAIFGGFAFGAYAALCAVPQKFL
jgi:hypothetical protein